MKTVWTAASPGCSDDLASPDKQLKILRQKFEEWSRDNKIWIKTYQDKFEPFKSKLRTRIKAFARLGPALWVSCDLGHQTLALGRVSGDVEQTVRGP
jgi:hypothetical protein